MPSSGTREAFKRFGRSLVTPLGRRDRSSRDPSPAPSTTASRPAPATTTIVPSIPVGVGVTTIHSTLPGQLDAARAQSSILKYPPAPVPPTQSKAFERAVAEVLKKHVNLSDDDRAAFQSASDVDMVGILRESQHGASCISDSLPRVHKVLECVNRFMGPLAIFIQHSPEISSLVVGGLHCILMLGLGYIEFFESLTSMIDRFVGHLSYLSDYAGTAFQNSEKIQEALVTVYCDLLDFYVKVRDLFTNQDGKQSYAQGFRLFFKVAWEPFEEQFQSIETSFIDHTNIIVRLANVEHQILYKEEAQDSQRRKRREILRWLSWDDFEETHDRHYKKRCENTGQWLLDDPRLISWRDSEQSSLLWCHGAPGSGKTVLASLVVEHLSALYQLSSHSGVTFVYCNYKEPRTSATYIRLAIKQLCRRMERLPSKLQEVYDKHYQNDSQPTSEELQGVFLAVAKQFNSIFLVLDALDECTRDQRAELCGFFSRLIELSVTSSNTGIGTPTSQAGPSAGIIQTPSTSSGCVKLFVTSRKEQDIERVFRQRSYPKVEIEAEKVDCDIAVYVKAQIEQRIQDESLTLQDMTLKEKILTALTTKASGMFLWAKFQLDEICAQISDYAIKKALERIPEDLNATYQRILDSISKKNRGQYELARRVLICIAYSRSPIPVGLLRYAVAVEEDIENLEALESSLPTETVIVDSCANLITIDENSRQVRFIHFSVQEYLTSAPSPPGIDAFRPGFELANREIARLFIMVLKVLYSEAPEDFRYVGIEKLLHHVHKLDDWQHHLIAGDLGAQPVDDTLLALLTSFFDHSPPIHSLPPYETPIYLSFSPSTLALIFNLPVVYKHYQPHPVYKKTLTVENLKAIYGCDAPTIIFDDRFAMHYVTIMLDSVPVAQRLCNYSYPIDYSGHSLADPGSNFQSADLTSGGNYWSEMPYSLKKPPLAFAKSEKMGIFLLDNGASTNPELLGRHLHDPLVEFASCHGKPKLIKLVSDRIVYQYSRRLNDALIAAISSGTEEIIQLLIGMGASVNAKVGYWGTVLQLAAENGGRGMKPLVSNGADVNAEGGVYGTALQCLAFNGKIEWMQLLLDKGADVNIQGGKYGTALQAAAFDVECIQLLLDKGADVNAMGGEYGTPLQAALFWDQPECIQLLLAHGADVNSEGGMYGTPLQAAAHLGRVEYIQLLLDKGANVNAEGGEHGTALIAAAITHRNSYDCIKLLLDSGADIHISSGEYGTALQAAVRRANVECMQLLLDKGADVNAKSGKFGTALQAAAHMGDIECVQLLIDNGADVDAKGGEFGTALQAATAPYPGNVPLEVIKLLLENGADINGVGGKYGTALQAAAAWPNLELMQLLLDEGADVNIEGGEYGTALQASAHAVEPMQLLLDKGANVNAPGGKYGTALHAAAYGGGSGCIELLLDRGANVNAKNGVYGTALQTAAVSFSDNSLEAMKLLLDRGADVDAVSGEYGTALQAATCWGKVQCVQLLVGKGGADVNAVGGKYGTALQAAAYMGKLSCAQVLLESGADVDTSGGSGEYGTTALQAASYACQLPVMKLLLAAGANVNARGGRYGTALQATLAPAPEGDEHLPAVRKNEFTVFDALELLLSHGADIAAYVEGSAYGDALTAAKEVWKDNAEALCRFMKLVEARVGGKGESIPVVG